MNPNQMPKKQGDKLKLRVLDGLVATSASSWDRKSLSKDDDGKEVVETEKVTHTALRYPLAQNVSDYNVERFAHEWL
jgi:hypothetical protein